MLSNRTQAGDEKKSEIQHQYRGRGGGAGGGCTIEMRMIFGVREAKSVPKNVAKVERSRGTEEGSENDDANRRHQIADLRSQKNVSRHEGRSGGEVD